MQRTPKKTKLPVKIAAKAGTPALSKVSKQEKPVASTKKTVIVADKILSKSKTVISTKIPKVPPKTKKTVAVNPSSKQEKAMAAAAAKKSTPKTVRIKAETGNKKSKTAKKKVEIVIAPIIQKPIKKKIKPIGPAVVRGKMGRYDFEVFSLDTDLKDGAAIYVISKRINDKQELGPFL